MICYIGFPSCPIYRDGCWIDPDRYRGDNSVGAEINHLHRGGITTSPPDVVRDVGPVTHYGNPTWINPDGYVIQNRIGIGINNCKLPIRAQIAQSYEGSVTGNGDMLRQRTWEWVERNSCHDRSGSKIHN